MSIIGPRITGDPVIIVDRKQLKHRIPSRFTINGESVSQPLKIADGFNNYFTTIGQDMANSIPEVTGYQTYVKRTYGKLELARPDSEIVRKIMRKQQPKLSCGLDTINNKVVKICSKELADPMAIIIGLSIREASVPPAFKLARIIPLFKKGAADVCGNYRPVSLISVLSEILEKVVCQQLMNNLQQDGFLCPDQYGFCPHSQTTHVVHKLLNIISSNAIKIK